MAEQSTGNSSLWKFSGINMCTNARMMLSVQRGPCWAANSSSLYELLAKEGVIEGVIEYDQGKGRGSFVFHDEEVLLNENHLMVTWKRIQVVDGNVILVQEDDRQVQHIPVENLLIEFQENLSCASANVHRLLPSCSSAAASCLPTIPKRLSPSSSGAILNCSLMRSVS